MSFGNRDACQIEGIDTIRIKLFDGMIGELNNVRYIPQLKRI